MTTLNQLPLSVKQSLKFLDALRFGFKQSPVLTIRHSDKIYYSIIISDSVKMVNYPAVRKSLAVNFLPDQYMLKAFFTIRTTNPNITILGFISATLPIRIFVPTPSIPNGMFQTPFRCISNEFTTDWARFSLSLRISIIVSTLYAFLRAIFLLTIAPLKYFATKNTSIFILHIRSIAQNPIFCNYVMGAKEFDLLQQTALKLDYLDKKLTEHLEFKKKPKPVKSSGKGIRIE